MNNSKFAMDSVSLNEEPTHQVEQLRERETVVVRILTALEAIEQSHAWSTLKEELFDPLATRLERELRDEARKEHPDTLVLTKISGQLQWAEKYADLGKMREIYREQLVGLRQQLHATE